MIDSKKIEEWKQREVRGISLKEWDEMKEEMSEADAMNLLSEIFDKPMVAIVEGKRVGISASDFKFDTSLLDEEDHMIWLEKYIEKNGVTCTMNLIWKMAYQIGLLRTKSKGYQLELQCPAIAHLTTRTDLNHLERTALMMTYLRLGDEKRLWEILESQKNFNRHISEVQIECYKKKKQIYGISCEKLIEWHICSDSYSDCNKFKEASNGKSS